MCHGPKLDQLPILGDGHQSINCSNRRYLVEIYIAMIKCYKDIHCPWMTIPCNLTMVRSSFQIAGSVRGTLANPCCWMATSLIFVSMSSSVAAIPCGFSCTGGMDLGKDRGRVAGNMPNICGGQWCLMSRSCLL